MSEITPPLGAESQLGFYSHDAVRQLVAGVGGKRPAVRTLRMWESRGLFPKRQRISYSRVAWRKSDIHEWLKDPEGWVAKNRKPSPA